MEPHPPVRTASTPPGDGRPAAWAGLYLLLAAAVYQPALRGAFLWDDDAHVTKPALRSLHGLGRIWFELGATQQYYPVLHTAFWVEHRAWGDAVLGYHLLNVVLHVAAAWLVLLILRKLAFPAAGLAGLLFLLHPVNVESVAWISEQKNTLSAVFYLAAALVYLSFYDRRGPGRYGAAFGLFILALLTKSVTATLPAALLVILWWRRGRLAWRRDVRPLLPWLAAAVASGLFTAWVERRYVGAAGADFSLSALQRVLLAGRVVVFYAGKLLWPANLIFIYPRWSVNPAVASAYAYGAGVLVVGALVAARARTARGPLAAWLFFVGTLFPVLGFVNVYPFLFSYVADHFQYLASLGIVVPAAWCLVRLARRGSRSAATRTAFLAVVPAVFAILSWRQCRQYRDADTLYRTTLERNPAAWLAHFNLGVSLASQGRLAEAISEYETVLRLKPDHWAARANLASAWLRIPGHTAEAIAEYEMALRLHPDFPEAEDDLGVALSRIPGRRDEAMAHLRAALRLRPDLAGAHNNLGVLLMQDPSRLSEAAGEFAAALRLAPDNAEYHYDLADALSELSGRLPDAVAEYRAAIRLRPGYVEAHGNLAVALARLHRLPEAIAELRIVVGLRPELDGPRRLLARLEALNR